MAWSFSSVGATSSSGAPASNRSKDAWAKASETLTYSSTSSTAEDLTSSVVDFIPKGKDFLVLANTGGTNLSSDADIAVQVCGTSSGTFVLLKDDLITSIDNKVAAALYDISSYGEAPFYKLLIDADGVEKVTDTVVLEVYWDPE